MEALKFSLKSIISGTYWEVDVCIYIYVHPSSFQQWILYNIYIHTDQPWTLLGLIINRQILLEGTILYVLVQLPAAQRARPRLLLQDKWCYQKADSTILSWTQTWPCNQLWVGHGNQQPPYTSHRNWPLSWPAQAIPEKLPAGPVFCRYAVLDLVLQGHSVRNASRRPNWEGWKPNHV